MSRETRYGVSTTSTPWGIPQDRTELAPGIVRVSTASHGGFILSEERMADFNAVLTIHFQSFAGYGYFEEDQDWAAVALAFPQFFSDEDIFHAVNTVRSSARPWESMPDIHLRWLPLVTWLDAPGNAVNAQAEAFKARRLDYWQVGSMSTAGHGWSVSLTRLKDGVRKIVQFADYPGDGFYSDADLNALGVA